MFDVQIQILFGGQQTDGSISWQFLYIFLTTNGGSKTPKTFKNRCDAEPNESVHLGVALHVCGQVGPCEVASTHGMFDLIPGSERRWEALDFRVKKMPILIDFVYLRRLNEMGVWVLEATWVNWCDRSYLDLFGEHHIKPKSFLIKQFELWDVLSVSFQDMGNRWAQESGNYGIIRIWGQCWIFLT